MALLGLALAAMWIVGVCWVGRALPPAVQGALIAVLPSILGLTNGLVRRKKQVVRLTLAGFGLGLVYLAGYWTPSVFAAINGPSVKISGPDSGRAGWTETITVNWSGLREGMSPVIFVREVSSGYSFPKSCGLPQTSSGQQRCTIEIGRESDAGKRFDLVGAMTGAAGRSEIASYRNSPIAAGIQTLSEHFSQLSVLPVQRR